MAVEVFVDTNVLVYAYDVDAGEKRNAALAIVERGWLEPGSTAISVQVLQEFYVNLQRKGRSHAEVAALVMDLAGWTVVENTLFLLRDALDLKGRASISFWDAMIVAAAKHSGAGILYSEDLNHGQEYRGVRVLNPFRKATS